MPFKSRAQRRKFAELLVEGEISPEVYERWNRETGRAELPERAKPARKKRAPRKTRKARPKSSSKRRPKRKAITRKKSKRRA
jgi:hypothetical protein